MLNDIGNERPVEFGLELQQLLGNVSTDDILRRIFLLSLPQSIVTAITTYLYYVCPRYREIYLSLRWLKNGTKLNKTPRTSRLSWKRPTGPGWQQQQHPPLAPLQLQFRQFPDLSSPQLEATDVADVNAGFALPDKRQP